MNLDKVRKVEAQADYVETVPENVRLMNEDRVRLSSMLVLAFWKTLIPRTQRKTLEAEVASLELSKETFAKLK